jgi:hypothetical protein
MRRVGTIVGAFGGERGRNMHGECHLVWVMRPSGRVAMVSPELAAIGGTRK